jgi:hypothetical protein
MLSELIPTSMFVGISSFSAAFLTALLADVTYIDKYFLEYGDRLKQYYLRSTSFLRKHGIPFDNVNAGLFLWIDLSRWLQRFPREGSDEEDSVDILLARWLIKKGVYIRPGKVCHYIIRKHWSTAWQTQCHL